MEAILDLTVLQIAAYIRCRKAVVMWVSRCLPDPPTVTLSIEPRSVLEGDRVTFTCQAHANPPIMGYRSASAYKHILIFTAPLKIKAATWPSCMTEMSYHFLVLTDFCWKFPLFQTLFLYYALKVVNTEKETCLNPFTFQYFSFPFVSHIVPGCVHIFFQFI